MELTKEERLTLAIVLSHYRQTILPFSDWSYDSTDTNALMFSKALRLENKMLAGIPLNDYSSLLKELNVQEATEDQIKTYYMHEGFSEQLAAIDEELVLRGVEVSRGHLPFEQKVQ